jgi:hypothetical protein
MIKQTFFLPIVTNKYNYLFCELRYLKYEKDILKIDI